MELDLELRRQWEHSDIFCETHYDKNVTRNQRAVLISFFGGKKIVMYNKSYQKFPRKNYKVNVKFLSKLSIFSWKSRMKISLNFEATIWDHE